MSFDFQTPIDRSGTHALKWDNVDKTPGAAPVVPLWVADMDFAIPPAVHEALTQRVGHPIYGYTNLPPAYFEAVIAWNRARYGRTLATGELLLAPSVLHGMSLAVRALTSPGDGLINLTPIYYQFFKMASLHDRRGLELPLRRRGLHWDIDLEALEQLLVAERAAARPVRALLFCNPQNPTGRVWTRAELEALAAVLVRHDVLLLSDEIHSDLVLAGHTHVSALDLPELRDHAVVFAGPNKTFNTAGLAISHVVVKNAELRSKLQRGLQGDFYDQPNALSLTAALAAYQHGGAWLDALLDLLADHYDVLGEVLSRWGLEATPLEATYLAWVDFSPLLPQLGFASDRDLAAWLEQTWRVKMTAGGVFRAGGANHLRFILATTRALLDEGLSRLDAALRSKLG